LKTGKGQIKDIVVVSCKKGEDLLQCLEEAIEKHNIKNGTILTGYGTLDKSITHMVTTTGFPVHEHFEEKEEPLEVLSISGIISNGSLHAHIVTSDTDQAYGGHLEPGCRTLYLCEIVIGIFGGIELSRKSDDNGLKLLEIN